jgi:hypothetical protein
MKQTAICFSILLSMGAYVKAQDVTYEWTGGTPGYSGTIVLDSPSSSGGSLSDIVSLSVTTPTNGTITPDLNPADGNTYLADPTFTWTPTQITEMGIIGYDLANDYIIVAQNFGGGGLNQLSGELNSTAFDEIDTSGTWTAVQIPEPGYYALLMALVVGCAVTARRFRVSDSSRIAT